MRKADPYFCYGRYLCSTRMSQGVCKNWYLNLRLTLGLA
jgi:hypothetical protein